MSSDSFFPPVPDGGVPADADQDEPWMNPDWAGPPWQTSPGLSALTVVLGRSSSTVVLVQGIGCHPSGLVLRLVVKLRERGREARRRVWQELDVTHGRGQLAMCLPPGGLRWGVEMADGRRVTTVDDYEPWSESPTDSDVSWTPDRPVMRGLARPSVYGSDWSREVWMWPLPPPGPLRLVCSWADRDIKETSTEIDAGPLRSTAMEATSWWED